MGAMDPVLESGRAKIKGDGVLSSLAGAGTFSRSNNVNSGDPDPISPHRFKRPP